MTGISNWTLARRSVAFYLKSHLGTILGAAIATAVLTGALLVGDSVRGSLRAMALARLGKVDTVLASGDRLFRAPGFARGHVVDFIAYNKWFVGNVADIAIVGGAAFLTVLTLLGMQARPAAVSAG